MADAAACARAMRAWRWRRSAPNRCAARHSRYQAPAPPQYNRRVHQVHRVHRVHHVLCCVMLAWFSVTTLAQTPSDANRDQAERAQRRIRALQAEADRLAAQSRTVFGDLRRLELERVIKQDELLNAERALQRTTVDRDAAAKRLKALEAIRIAGTPGVAERLVELSKRGRAGYVQLLLASDNVQGDGPNGARRGGGRRARSPAPRDPSQEPGGRTGRSRRPQHATHGAGGAPEGRGAREGRGRHGGERAQPADRRSRSAARSRRAVRRRTAAGAARSRAHGRDHGRGVDGDGAADPPVPRRPAVADSGAR